MWLRIFSASLLVLNLATPAGAGTDSSGGGGTLRARFFEAVDRARETFRNIKTVRVPGYKKVESAYESHRIDWEKNVDSQRYESQIVEGLNPEDVYLNVLRESIELSDESDERALTLALLVDATKKGIFPGIALSTLGDCFGKGKFKVVSMDSVGKRPFLVDVRNKENLEGSSIDTPFEKQIWLEIRQVVFNALTTLQTAFANDPRNPIQIPSSASELGFNQKAATLFDSSSKRTRWEYATLLTRLLDEQFLGRIDLFGDTLVLAPGEFVPSDRLSIKLSMIYFKIFNRWLSGMHFLVPLLENAKSVALRELKKTPKLVASRDLSADAAHLFNSRRREWIRALKAFEPTSAEYLDEVFTSPLGEPIFARVTSNGAVLFSVPYFEKQSPTVKELARNLIHEMGHKVGLMDREPLDLIAREIVK